MSQMATELGDMVGVRTKPKIAKSITELIGNTPLLQLGRSAEGIDATILAKLESFEPCNSCAPAYKACRSPRPSPRGLSLPVVRVAALSRPVVATGAHALDRSQGEGPHRLLDDH